jgi:4'-phosphopantetheinyl transferase
MANRRTAGKGKTLGPDFSAGQETLGNEVHVWTARLDREAEELHDLEATLSPDERARADRFHFARDRQRFVAARGVLRTLLGKYLRQAPASLEFSYGPYGKPSLAGANAARGLSFNLAHSAELAVYAISRQRNLGVDVERIKPESAGEDIARRFFSAREVGDLQTLPPEARVAAFFNCWTRKEAYLKATGMGLQTPLDSFSVSLWPGEPAQFLAGVEARWHLAAFDPSEGYTGAVVYDGSPSPVKLLSVPSR